MAINQDNTTIQRRSTDYTFYNSRRWRNYSRRFRLLCEVCEGNGLYEPADVTDHIVPMKQGGAKWNELNHMGMCHSHHNRKRGLESHGHCVVTAVGTDGLLPNDREEIVNILLAKDRQNEDLWID